VLTLNKTRFAAKWILLACLTVILSACSIDGQGGPAAARPERYPVDPAFKEFYQALGGDQILGPAISPLEQHENHIQCQFAERALLCLNPEVTDNNRYFLYPLGLELKIQRDEYLDWSVTSPDARMVNGFPIYEKFIPLYDKLYGERFVGPAITALRINSDLHRAEQFFENVGFYQDLGSPDNPVYLIPYGAYLCGGNCSYRLHEYWSTVRSSTVDQPFAPLVARLGGPSVFGELMLKATYAADGALEQTYTNAIFYSPPDNPAQVNLRPLPLMLHYEVQPLTAPINHEQLVFYEVEGGLGHNVPLVFDQFIALHGGRDLSGKPISEVMRLPQGNLYRQCFENYCLVFDPGAPELLKVRLAALGQEYLERYPAPDDLQITDLFSSSRIALIASTDQPNLGNGIEQVVRIMVQERETSSPLARVESTLVLNYPDRPAVRSQLPPTDDNGMSMLAIPSEAGLTNGTRLWYQVCLNLPSEQPICQVDSYMIWDPGH
jgi:hypothetical protein